MIYNITDIAYEQIAGDYHWARYGEFKVIMNVKSGYINATHLCGLATTSGGKKKEYKEWYRCDTAKSLISELSSDRGIPPADIFVKAIGGHTVDIRGTYAHPDLIPHIASWASPKFAVKVSKIINAQLVREYKETLRIKDDKIDELQHKLDKVIEQNDEVLSKNDKIMKQNEELILKGNEQTHLMGELRIEAKEAREEANQMQEQLNDITTDLEDVSTENLSLAATVDTIASRLNIATEDRVPKHPDDKRNAVLAVYHKPNSQQYRMIRRQKISLGVGVDACIELGYTEQIYYNDSPNAVNLGARLRNSLPKHVGKVSGVNITIHRGKTINDLLGFIRDTDNEKKKV